MGSFQQMTMMSRISWKDVHFLVEHRQLFFKKIGGYLSILLFRTSGDISSEFQSQSWQPYSDSADTYTIYVPRDSLLVRHLCRCILNIDNLTLCDIDGLTRLPSSYLFQEEERSDAGTQTNRGTDNFIFRGKLSSQTPQTLEVIKFSATVNAFEQISSNDHQM